MKTGTGSRCFGTALAILALGYFATATNKRQQRKDEPREVPEVSEHSITEDLSQDHRFTVRVGIDLPDFTFRIVPDLREPDKYGNAYTTIKGIEVLRGASARPFQRLPGCDWEGSEPPPALSLDWFRADDFNFDGYQDVYVMTNWGVTGNQYGCIWLYDPRSGRFSYSKEFSKLARYWINPGKKVLFTFATGGGGTYVAEKYRVENNRPVLVWSESQDGPNGKEQLHCVVKERRGQDIATIIDKWALPGDMAPACDGARFFTNPDTMWSDH